MLSLVPVAGVPVVAAVPDELYGPLQLAPLQHHCIAGVGAPLKGMNTKMYDTELILLFVVSCTLQEHFYLKIKTRSM